METVTGEFYMPMYFLMVAFGASILAWWFLSRKDKTLKMFGLGMAGYAAGMVAWSALVFIQPEDLRPLALTGAIPFLLAHLAYAKVAYSKLDSAKANTLLAVVAAMIAGTFIIRTFIYPSEPYFSEGGQLFFGLHPWAVAFYIATISITFLPAISIACSKIKQIGIKNTLRIGLTTLFITEIILASGSDETLLSINGAVMTVALLITWLVVIASSTEDPKIQRNRGRPRKRPASRT